VSSAETVYTVRTPYPDYLVRGRAQTVSLPLYRDGALVAPTASGSTFALLDAAGSEVVAAAAVTVTGSVATRALTAPDLPSTLALGRGYREVWHLVLPDGSTRDYRRDASLVLYAAYPVITDGDLTGVYSDLDRQLKSGTTTFQSYIDEAWKRILGRLEGQGVFPECIVTDWSLREVHMELTLHLICLDCGRAAGGRWLELAAGHKKEFEMAWSRLRFATSTDGANADGSAMRPANKGVVFLNASPRATWRGFGGL